MDHSYGVIGAEPLFGAELAADDGPHVSEDEGEGLEELDDAEEGEDGDEDAVFGGDLGGDVGDHGPHAEGDVAVEDADGHGDDVGGLPDVEHAVGGPDADERLAALGIPAPLHVLDVLGDVGPPHGGEDGHEVGEDHR